MRNPTSQLPRRRSSRGRGIVIPILSPDKPVLHCLPDFDGDLCSGISKRTPIEDRTGLTGRYDFDLMHVNTEGDPGMDWN